MTEHAPRPEFASRAASDWLARLENAPPRFPYPAGAAAILGAACVDYYTGTSLSVAFLYVPAVAGLGWLLGRRAGFQAAAASAFVSVLANWPAPGEGALEGATVWNAIAVGLLLAAVGFLAGEIRANRQQLRHAATVDPLTGLHNRASFLVALGNEMTRAERFGGETSLLCLEIDGFKRVNEQQGQEAGDALLKAVSSELGESVRRTDLVARIGSDEFAVILTQTGPVAAQNVSVKVSESLHAWAAKHQHPVGFSLGWASAPLAAGMSAEQLLARATATLTERKRDTRGARPSGTPTLTGTTANAL